MNSSIASRLKSYLGIKWSSQSLLRARRKCKTLEDICNLTFEWSGRGGCWKIKSLQNLEEMIPFFESVKQRRPKVCMEVGTCHGGTLFTLLTVADPEAFVISIDLPGGIHGGGSTDQHARFMAESFPSPRQELHLIRDDSHAWTTREKAEKILGNRKLDYLFIDGDHRYEGVKQDFLLYAPLVRKGGMIAFHDVTCTPPGVEVNRLWDEIKACCSTQEYVAKNSEAFGIGVIPDWDPIALKHFPDAKKS